MTERAADAAAEVLIAGAGLSGLCCALHLQAQEVDWLDPIERPVRLAEGLFVCGDHRDNASIQGAMVSGRRAAEAVLADTR